MGKVWVGLLVGVILIVGALTYFRPCRSARSSSTSSSPLDGVMMKEIAQTRRRGSAPGTASSSGRRLSSRFPSSTLERRSRTVMFVVEISVLTTLVLIQGLIGLAEVNLLFVTQITLWLWFTVLFANFAEAMAETRVVAQADTLRRTRRDTRRSGSGRDGSIETIHSTDLPRATS